MMFITLLARADAQGLATLTYGQYKTSRTTPGVHAYRGRGGAFMAYVIGSEYGGSSELPPPSIQSRATIAMYAKRDGYICHLCGIPIDGRDGRFMASPDHLIPRIEGGSDYPSNIKSSHLSCNKGRGSRAVDSRATHGAFRESLTERSTTPHPLSKEEGVRSEEYGSGSKDLMAEPVSERRLADSATRDVLKLAI